MGMMESSHHLRAKIVAEAIAMTPSDIGRQVIYKDLSAGDLTLPMIDMDGQF